MKDVLDRYTAGGRTGVAEDAARVESDFDQATTTFGRDDLSDGLAAAFRSAETPPFPNMLGDLFGRSTGTQRANVLNMLLQAVGPAILSQVLARRGGGTGGGLGDLLDTNRGSITPDVAEKIPADVVAEAAREAEKKDPSIVDKLSQIYAEQPQLVKSLGAAALAIAIGRMASRRNTL